MTDGLVLEQPSCHKQHVSVQNVGNKCVSMLDMSQRKMVIPETWKMSKEHHASPLVFSQKLCPPLQHGKQEPTPSTATLLSRGDRDQSQERLRELEFAGQRTREKGQWESSRNLHRSPLEARMELYETRGKWSSWKEWAGAGACTGGEGFEFGLVIVRRPIKHPEHSAEIPEKPRLSSRAEPVTQGLT